MDNIFGNYLSTSELRFLIAILLTVVFSRLLTERKGLKPILCGLLLLYITFGYVQLVYLFTAFVINMSLLFFFKFKEYPLTVVNFCILYIFKVKGSQFYPYIEGTCDISGALMLITIKMSYLGRDFDKKKHSFEDVVGYLFCIPGLILGPTTTFLEFTEPQKNQETSCIFTFLYSLLFLVLVKYTEKLFPERVLYDKNINFFGRLVNLYFFNFGRRCRFYFAWHYSNGCFILQKFYNMLNINFLKVETATCIKDLSLGWNIKTNKWLKECYFDKLKHKNIFLASFVTFTVSALWHGIAPGYLIMFLSFCFAIPVIKGVNKLMLRYIPTLYPVLSKLQMIFFVMYFSIPFFLLEVDKIMKVWYSLYFYGHIYCGMAFVLHIIHSF